MKGVERMATEVRRALRAGGLKRSRRTAVLPADTPDHPLSNSGDVCGLLAASINQVRRGELDPRLGNAMASTDIWPLVDCRSEFVNAQAAGGVRVFPLDRASVGGLGVDVTTEFASQVRERGKNAAPKLWRSAPLGRSSKNTFQFFLDSLRIMSNQSIGSQFDGYGMLRVLPYGQTRNSQGRCPFLNTAGLSDHNVALCCRARGRDTPAAPSA
jgi:hypothetical protein